MELTVADLCSTPSLKGMRLIAGRDGLTNAVKSCGILDYEYDKAVSEKYYSINFQKGQFILSSFLYAKDNEYLVMDAVKKLVARGCSGLAIKNIFRIPFHDNLLRYADSMKFPIFVIEDSTVYFEQFIIDTAEKIKQYDSFYMRAGKARLLMSLPEDTDPQARLQLCLEINPALCSDLLVLCLHMSEPFPAEEYFQLERQLCSRLPLHANNSLFYYKNGFLMILSSEMFTSADAELLAADYIRAICEECGQFQLGVSKIHHSLHALGKAMEESIHAAALHKVAAPDRPCLSYGDLGVYQLLLPTSSHPAAEALRRQYLQPLEDYDIEHKTNLFPTILQFVLCGGNVDKTAEALFQHKNTVRYRIEKVNKLYGFSILQPEHYEKVSIAAKLHLCAEAMEGFA